MSSERQDFYQAVKTLFGLAYDAGVISEQEHKAFLAYLPRDITHPVSAPPPLVGEPVVPPDCVPIRPFA
jgi:hypothetical protein